jgi:cell division protein FtsX
VLYNATVYRDARGAVLGVFAAARDVTELKRASEHARSLIEASLDPLVTISAEGKITDVNEATTRVTGVDRAELVAATDSAARLQQALGADSALLDGVELASLPASVEVTLAPGMRDVIAMSPTVRALRGAQGVDDIVVEDAGSERVAGTLGTVRLVAWSAAAFLAGLALLVALSAIRVCFERDEREIAIAQMLGASPFFLVVPTAFAGALHGALAALLAAVALYAGIAVYGDAIITALHGALGAVELVPPAPMMCVLFVALGTAVGFVGGGLAGASRAAR